MSSDPVPPRPIERLLAVVARLRDPEHGCAWDLAQTFASLAPYAIEEGYEVADALTRGDPADIKDELGDLLLQVVLNAQVARDMGAFDFGDVAGAIADKMVRRHPHVFGPIAADGRDKPDWEAIKAAERGERGADASVRASALGGVALGLPALMRADKIQRRAARVGFDWPDASGPRAKIDEELGEVDTATTPDELGDEIGDLLFSVVNLARHKGVDAEAALRGATAKFERRFRLVEQSPEFEGADLERLERLWESAKLEA